MDKPWFNEETGHLLLDEYMLETPSFIKIMEDGVVTASEVMEQSHRVIELLKELEARLDPETRELTTRALCELSVLYIIARKFHESR